jgi:hypothetical protein
MLLFQSPPWKSKAERAKEKRVEKRLSVGKLRLMITHKT